MSRVDLVQLHNPAEPLRPT